MLSKITVILTGVFVTFADESGFRDSLCPASWQCRRIKDSSFPGKGGQIMSGQTGKLSRWNNLLSAAEHKIWMLPAS